MTHTFNLKAEEVLSPEMLAEVMAAKKKQHTPGPWAYDGEDMDSAAAHLIAAEEGTTHDGYEIFSVDKNGEVDMPIGTALEEADAAIIAAAPDMAEALKLALEACDDDRSWEDMAIAALAKAGVK